MDYDLNHSSVTINSPDNTLNKYGTSISSSSLNYAVKNNDNTIFNVTLDVFSGRPNPTWVLTKEQALFFSK